jgi:site-specific DNA-adenine methylase
MSMKASYYADPDAKSFEYVLDVKGKHIGYQTFISKVRRLVENALKLRQCQILNSDGVDVMKRFDHEAVFMFVDPPYLSTTVRSKNKIYTTEYDDGIHYRIIEFVRNAKSKIMLASYPNELYDQLLDYGWVRIDKTKYITAGHCSSKQKKRPRRIESLYLNYQPPARHVSSVSLPLA